MQRTSRWFTAILAMGAMTAGLLAQTSSPASSTTPAKKKKPAAAAAASEQQVEQLKALVQAQQQQLTQQSRQVEALRSQMQELLNATQQANAAAQKAQSNVDQAQSAASAAQQEVAAVKGDVTDLKNNVTNTALSLQETQKNLQGEIESPLAIHFRGVTLTPGGFLSADTVWRQHALGSDISTSLNSIPFPGSSTSAMSEFYASGRATRPSLLVEGKLKSATLRGYAEADFLSSGISSNSNSTNSYTLRERQGWAQAALASGWTFIGGQMWTLLTETKNGTDNLTEAPPLTIDNSYNAGFTYARQYGLRVSKNLNNKMWLAFAVENAQTTVGGHGSEPNFLLGQQGNSSGYYNPTANYSYNATPDFIGKVVFQPGFGHYEVFGVISDFRDRIFPGALLSTPTATGAYNNSSKGGGAGANARVTIAKHFDAGLHFFGGDGVGRYGTGGISDVTVRQDGVLAPIRSYQSLASLEWHSKHLDTYFYFGGEYGGRTAFGNTVGYGATGLKNAGCSMETVPAATTTTAVTSTSKGTTAKIPNGGAAGSPLSNGFDPGSLSNCTGDTRSLLEGTLGFWYKFYTGPMGRIQFGPQYSYISRNTWWGNGGQPQATENMVLTSFRYYLP
jgi:hypothetical protein